MRPSSCTVLDSSSALTTCVARPSSSASCGGDRAREVEQLHRLGASDQPRQRPARAGVAGQRHPGEGGVVAGRVDQDPEVGGEGQARAGARGDAVDRGDDRLGHRGERVHDRVVVLLDRVGQRHVGVALQTGQVLLEVLAHAEGTPAAGEHDAPHRRVGGDRLHGLEQQVLGGHVEAVHGLGPVEGDGGDRVGDVEQDGGHGGSLPDGRRSTSPRAPCGADHAVHGG